MIFSGILFFISLLCIAILIAFRNFELARGKDLISVATRANVDRKVSSVLRLAQHVCIVMVHVLRDLAHLAIDRTYSFIVKIFHKAHNRISKYIDMVKGRGVLSRGGSASFFISALAEDVKVRKGE